LDKIKNLEISESECQTELIGDDWCAIECVERRGHTELQLRIRQAVLHHGGDDSFGVQFALQSGIGIQLVLVTKSQNTSALAEVHGGSDLQIRRNLLEVRRSDLLSLIPSLNGGSEILLSVFDSSIEILQFVVA